MGIATWSGDPALQEMLMCGKVTHNNLIDNSSPIPSVRYSYF